MRSDSVTAFAFESLPVRGALVQLSTAWKRMQRDHRYDALLTETLGHATAATGLIAQSLKFEGAITLQIQGAGALQMLVVQCTSELQVRGMATLAAHADVRKFGELTRGAHCAITVDNGDRPYQGIVAIDESSLAASLHHYFGQSVQVPSHIALVADGAVAAGLLLQQMPGKPMAKDDWARLGFLTDTLALKDFDGDAGMALLGKLFSEDDVRVFESRDLQFQCRCSNKKAEDVLKMLGPDESRDALTDTGVLEIVCEYCGEQRRFDSVDIEKLFAANVVRGPESVQ